MIENELGYLIFTTLVSSVIKHLDRAVSLFIAML